MAKNSLMGRELEILRGIPTSGTMLPRAYAVWRDTDGVVEMGPVRARRELSDGTMEYECSPFPGAWNWHVAESDILRVRHLAALSLATMECVCRGTEYDRRCPSEHCTTPAR